MRTFQIAPTGALHLTAIVLDQQVFDTWNRLREVLAFFRRHDGERSCQSAGVGGIRRHNSGTDDFIDGMTGTRIHDVRKVMTADINATTIVTAGGNGEVVDGQT